MGWLDAAEQQHPDDNLPDQRTISAHAEKLAGPGYHPGQTQPA